MKILITGSGGMLAKDLIPILSDSYKIAAFNSKELDITDRSAAFSKVKDVMPDIVINCAAYTHVDKAEGERERAFLVNGIGAQNIALACRNVGIPLCHISTDYVFDGSKNALYTPFDNTNPINVYGESKLAAEKYIEWIMDKFYILRTSWLYGKGGNNFVSTMIRLAKEQPSIKVVKDQTGSPTSAVTLSHAIKSLITTGAYGIHHFTDRTGEGISWFDFAKEIVSVSGLSTEIIPVTTDEFPRPAKRPKNSALDTTTFSMSTGHRPVDWRDSLKDFLKG